MHPFKIIVNYKLSIFFFIYVTYFHHFFSVVLLLYILLIKIILNFKNIILLKNYIYIYILFKYVCKSDDVFNSLFYMFMCVFYLDFSHMKN
jgi:hypothetical protein